MRPLPLTVGPVRAAILVLVTPHSSSSSSSSDLLYAPPPTSLCANKKKVTGCVNGTREVILTTLAKNQWKTPTSQTFTSDAAAGVRSSTEKSMKTKQLFSSTTCNIVFGPKKGRSALHLLLIYGCVLCHKA